MTTRLHIQLPSDLDLLRLPQRGPLAALRVALMLTEQDLLGRYPGLRRDPFPAPGESRSIALARALVVRAAELHALTDAYEQLLCSPVDPDEDSDIPY